MSVFGILLNKTHRACIRALPNLSLNYAANSPPAKISNESYVMEKMGICDTPNVGGSINPELALEDTRNLGAKSALALNPTESYIAAMRKLNPKYPLIFRFYDQFNALNKEGLSQLLATRGFITPNFPLQFLNEPNIEPNKEGIITHPRLIAQRFIEGTIMIAEKGGIGLLPPTAQDTKNPQAETRYFDTMVKELPNLADKNWLEEYVALSIHAYHMNPGDISEDIWDRIKRLAYNYTQVTGINPKIYITECGPRRNIRDGRNTGFIEQEDKQAVDALKRLAKARIPDGLNIVAFNYWIYANLAQRPPVKDGTISDELASFELAALRRKTGPTAAYYEFAKLAKEFT